MADAATIKGKSKGAKALAAALITLGLIAASLWLFQLPQSPYELSAIDGFPEAAADHETTDDEGARSSFAFQFDEEAKAAMAVLVLSDQPVRAVHLNASQLPAAQNRKSFAILPHGSLHGTVIDIPRYYLLPGRNLVDVLPSADSLPPQIVYARLLASDDAVTALGQLRYWGTIMPTLLLTLGGLAVAACLGGLLMGMRKTDYIPLLFLSAIFVCVGAMSQDFERLKALGLEGATGLALLIGYALFTGATLFERWRSVAPLSTVEWGALAAAVIWLCLSVTGLVAGLMRSRRFTFFVPERSAPCSISAFVSRALSSRTSLLFARPCKRWKAPLTSRLISLMKSRGSWLRRCSAAPFWKSASA